jgi:hypothetical protein
VPPVAALARALLFRGSIATLAPGVEGPGERPALRGPGAVNRFISAGFKKFEETPPFRRENARSGRPRRDGLFVKEH